MTLFVGGIFGSMIGGEPSIGFAFTLVAGVCSAPFIVIFSIIMFIYLKKKPTKSELHIRTFFLHILGSCITVALLVLMVGEEIPGELFLAIFGYFVIDSLFFHAFIQMKHEQKEDAPVALNDDILDSHL